MQSKYEKTVPILPSLCDGSARLSVPGCLGLFMDIAAEHAENLGIGFSVMGPKGLFWLTVKTQIQIVRMPRLMENTLLTTWPEKPERLRCNRDYALSSPTGEILVTGKTEWAVLNTQNGRLCEIADVYPKDLVLPEEQACPLPFDRVDGDFPGEPFFRYTVRSTDIDLGGHMNNVAYARALFSALSSQEWKALRPRRVQLAYRASCFEGDTLEFRRRDSGDAVDFSLSLPDGKPILLARIQ